MSDQPIPQVPLIQIRDGNFPEWIKERVNEMKRKSKQKPVEEVTPPPRRRGPAIPREFLRDVLWLKWHEQCVELMEATKLTKDDLTALLYSVGTGLHGNNLNYDLERARRIFEAVMAATRTMGAPPSKVDLRRR